MEFRTRPRRTGARDGHGEANREATKSDHDIATNMYTKVPAIVAPSADTEKWAAACSTAKSWPLVEEHTAREGPRRTCSGTPKSNSRLHQHLKARSGAKTTPKARRRKQGTELKLCLLRLSTTQGTWEKEV